MATSQHSSPVKKLQPIDYAFMIGGPVAFVLLMVVCWSFLIGPRPPMNPISLLKGGKVRVGMSVSEVESTVGSPKYTTTNPDGSEAFHYQGSQWEPSRKVVLGEDATVNFDASGRVSSLSFNSEEPPPLK